jgi:hypothetical protein
MPKSISGKNDGVPCVDDKSTFSLTWEGLKVVNTGGTVLRIGDGAKAGSNSTNILEVSNSGRSSFAITADGSINMAGNINIGGNITWDIVNNPSLQFNKADALILSTSGTNAQTNSRTRNWSQMYSYEQPGYTNLSGWAVTKAGYDAIKTKGKGSIEGVIIGVPVTISDRNDMVATIYLMVTGNGTSHTDNSPYVAVRGV